MKYWQVHLYPILFTKFRFLTKICLIMILNEQPTLSGHLEEVRRLRLQMLSRFKLNYTLICPCTIAYYENNLKLCLGEVIGC